MLSQSAKAMMSTVAAAMSTTATDPTDSAAHSDAAAGVRWHGSDGLPTLTSEYPIIEINEAVTAAPAYLRCAGEGF